MLPLNLILTSVNHVTLTTNCVMIAGFVSFTFANWNLYKKL